MSKFKLCIASAIAFSTLSLGAQASWLNQIFQWSSWGQNINSNHNNLYADISKDDVNNLVQLCAIDYRAGPNDPESTILSKPTIVDDVIYWTAQTGQIGAHQITRDKKGNFVNCDMLWQHGVNDVVDTDVLGLTSRATPAYYKRRNGKGTLLYLTPSNIFDFLQVGQFDKLFTHQPIAYALDAKTGRKLWQVPVAWPGGVDDSAIFLTTTSSPTVHGGHAYFGLASFNNLQAFLGIPVPNTARGHMIQLDLKVNGGVPSFPQDVKTLYSVPKRPQGYEGPWFAGGGVWASSPSIIPYGGKENKGLVIFGSGQLYDYPTFVSECMTEIVPDVVINGETYNRRGETGGGSQECYDRAVDELVNLGVDVQNEPLASNSVIAVNLADFSHAWHVPTNGIDAWQAGCGTSLENRDSPSCTVAVPGPDWDISGSSPMVVRYDFKTVVLSHNKSGELFWINPQNGHVFRHVDLCVASAAGGTHWGFSYDPIRKTMVVPCSGADLVNAQDYNATLANGKTYCRTGYLNGLDVRTGALKWQALPARAIESGAGSVCPDGKDVLDERFKLGKVFDIVHKNTPQPGVPIKAMPDSNQIPIPGNGATGDGAPSTSQGIAYWGLSNGVVYAVDVLSGDYLNQFYCDQGGIYTSSPSIANGYLAFGCGRNPSSITIPAGASFGHSIMVYGQQKVDKDKNKGKDDE